MQPETRVNKYKTNLGGRQGPDHAQSLGHVRGLHFILRALGAAPGRYEAAGDMYR